MVLTDLWQPEWFTMVWCLFICSTTSHILRFPTEMSSASSITVDSIICCVCITISNVDQFHATWTLCCLLSHRSHLVDDIMKTSFCKICCGSQHFWHKVKSEQYRIIPFLQSLFIYLLFGLCWKCPFASQKCTKKEIVYFVHIFILLPLKLIWFHLYALQIIQHTFRCTFVHLCQARTQAVSDCSLQWDQTFSRGTESNDENYQWWWFAYICCCGEQGPALGGDVRVQQMLQPFKYHTSFVCGCCSPARESKKWQWGKHRGIQSWARS